MTFDDYRNQDVKFSMCIESQKSISHIFCQIENIGMGSLRLNSRSILQGNTSA